MQVCAPFVEMGLFPVLLETQQNPDRSSEVTADQLAAATGSAKVLVGGFSVSL